MLADLPVPEGGGGGSPGHAASFQKSHERAGEPAAPCPASQPQTRHGASLRAAGGARLSSEPTGSSLFVGPGVRSGPGSPHGVRDVQELGSGRSPRGRTPEVLVLLPPNGAAPTPRAHVPRGKAAGTELPVPPCSRPPVGLAWGPREPALGGRDGESEAAAEQCGSWQDALYNPEPRRTPK